MARILSQTLIHDSATLLSSKSLIPLSPSSRLLNLRNRSTKSQSQNHLIEVDLSSSSSEEADLLGMRRLEDAIHGIIVRRAAPDWLPFVPGASYWVPPRRNRSLGLAELVGRLANPLSDDESMALTTVRGWPSSSYFVEGFGIRNLGVKGTLSLSLCGKYRLWNQELGCQRDSLSLSLSLS